MIETLIVAGAILASAAILYFRREPKDVRQMARTLVRAVEKRGEWDETLTTEHIKRARVRLVLLEEFPKMDEDWVDVIIEEAVFDMEVDRDRSNIKPGRGDLGIGDTDVSIAGSFSSTPRPWWFDEPGGLWDRPA